MRVAEASVAELQVFRADDFLEFWQIPLPRIALRHLVVKCEKEAVRKSKYKKSPAEMRGLVFI